MKAEDILVLVEGLETYHKEQLKKAAPSAVFTFQSPEKVTQEEMEKAEVIVGNPPKAMLQYAKRLKLLQLESAGTGFYVEKGVVPEGAYLANATGAYGLAIAEHMLAMTLMLMKKLNFYYDNQHQCLWQPEGRVPVIDGCNTLIVGAGDIGGEFAKRMHVLGSHVRGIRRTVQKTPDYMEEQYTMDQLDQLLGWADIVALSLPDTPATRNLFDLERFKKMKKTAILINVGRGTVINTEDLTIALEKGFLAGAGLDVTEPEPLPADHPLWKQKNLILTPHVSGGHYTLHTLDKIIQIAVNSIKNLLSDKEPDNIVDFETGYKRR